MAENPGRESLRAGLMGKYFLLLRGIELGYPCIHYFIRDFARFVQADGAIVLQQTGNDWAIICNISNDALGGIGEGEAIRSRFIDVWLKRIVWLPGEMKEERYGFKQRSDVLAIPIWRDSGYVIEKCMILLIRPRLLSIELNMSSLESSVPLFKQFYRIIYYWLTKGFYEHRITGHMCRQITAGTVDLLEADRSIKSPDEEHQGLMERGLGWPADFREVKDMFGAFWFMYLRINEKWDLQDYSVEFRHAFWQRGHDPGVATNDRSWWEEVLEKDAQQKLCHPYTLCTVPVCPPEERAKKRMFAEICTFIKWPLLFAEKRYDHAGSMGNDPQAQMQWLHSAYEKLVGLTQPVPFVNEEYSGDGNAGQRPSVCFR